ncbi:MAG: hypothetical protein IT373_06970 [Polyangiaceae bacterium]|nr:hypothetical protein [Polyangiaceae bacterium]
MSDATRNVLVLRMIVRVSRSLVAAVVLAGTTAGTQACSGGAKCGPGTHEDEGVCVPDSVATSTTSAVSSAAATVAPTSSEAPQDTTSGKTESRSTIAAASASTPSDEPPCGTELDTGCSLDLFVQLLTVPSTTAASYDYPEVQALLRGNPSYHGVRVVEAKRAPRKGIDPDHDTLKRVGAVVRNRCQADRLTRDAQAALKSGAGALCEKLAVLREVVTIQ